MTNKRMYRSQNNKILAGVAGGMAEYFDVDPAFIRIIFVFVTLMSAGAGFFIYIIMVIVLPIENNIAPSQNPDMDTETKTPQPPTNSAGQYKNRRLFGVIVIAVGLWLLLKNVGLVPSINFGMYWPLLLIGAGLLVLFKK